MDVADCCWEHCDGWVKMHDCACWAFANLSWLLSVSLGRRAWTGLQGRGIAMTQQRRVLSIHPQTTRRWTRKVHCWDALQTDIVRWETTLIRQGLSRDVLHHPSLLFSQDVTFRENSQNAIHCIRYAPWKFARNATQSPTLNLTLTLTLTPTVKLILILKLTVTLIYRRLWKKTWKKRKK